jgi:putative Mg2+ transporter-C (MgtC) family protein
MVIGLDREIRNSTAGLRTHMLVALAASLFGLIAFELVATFGADTSVTQLDPTRLVEAVTTGVAFLGAGAIIHSSGKVRGLTTGAGMWMAGAVGLACGIGYISVAALATGFALVILVPLRYFEARILTSRSKSTSDTEDEEETPSR